MRDLFQILRISASASDADVRSAYRRVALETHPDKGGSADAFRLVVEAFEILSDPCRRAAYQAASDKLCRHDPHAGMHASAHNTNTDVSRKHHPASKPHKDRKSAEKSQTSERPTRERANERSQSHADANHDDMEELLCEFLKLSQKTWESSLHELSEATLRRLVEILESGFEPNADDNEENDCSDTVENADMQGEINTLAILDELEDQEKSEIGRAVLAEAEFDSDNAPGSSLLAGESSSQPRKQSVHMRGICKSHGTFFAMIGLEYMLILSQGGLALDTAIDMHISLVQLRRQVRMDLDAGLSFRPALQKGIQKMQEERELFQTARLILSFRTQCPLQKLDGKWRREAMQTRDVDEALNFWEQSVAVIVQKKYETKRERIMQEELAQQLRAERRRKRAAELEEKMAKRQRREALRKEKSQQKDHIQTEKKTDRATQKRASLRMSILKILNRAKAMRSKVLKKRWGVHELPDGIEEASLHETADCLRATLVLSDGSVRPGPLRQTLAEAHTDLKELYQLKLKGGDSVACKELERRDIHAMTEFFREEVLKR